MISRIVHHLGHGTACTSMTKALALIVICGLGEQEGVLAEDNFLQPNTIPTIGLMESELCLPDLAIPALVTYLMLGSCASKTGYEHVGIQK